MITLLSTPELVTDNVLYRINKLIEHIQFLKSRYPEDREANKQFDWIINELNIIRNLALYNPRFGWTTVQREMDRIFKVDPTITGYNLFLDFIFTDNPKRPIIHGLISKK
ncbi:hypothetical protein DHD05_18220 [Arenibacter sp. N53]|uniref:hypothetical protein n=1 Tax=Arenibacter TaxID=178469 RepID=UPI000CD4532F|nr:MULTISPECIES: hypothetical protein [Arenibacter]MCM4153534.1 hypothetical protein [Arenibacter sp. N53]